MTSDSTDYEGVYLTATRLNHSCIPNACLDRNETFDRLTVYAFHEIAAD